MVYWPGNRNRNSTSYQMNSFQNQCQAIADLAGVDVDFNRNSESSEDCYHDDGHLHINRGHDHAFFWVGQDNRAQALAMTKKILAALGIKHTERTSP